MNHSNKTIRVMAKIALSLLFIISGAQKIMAPDHMAPLFTALGLPGKTAVVIGVFELTAGLTFVFVRKTSIVASVMLAWCIITAFIGHRFWIDPTQTPNFLKNIGLAGAFLLFATDRPALSAQRSEE